MVEASREKGEITAGPEDIASLNLDRAMEHHIRRVLDLTGGKVQGPGGAAELLGINAGSLRHWMTRLAVQYGRKTKAQSKS